MWHELMQYTIIFRSAILILNLVCAFTQKWVWLTKVGMVQKFSSKLYLHVVPTLSRTLFS